MINWFKRFHIDEWIPLDSSIASSPSLSSLNSSSSFDAGATRLTRLLSLFVILGLFARVVRYYLCFPLWDDESFLCVNLIDRSFADLLKPLDYHQVAPILFLWIERASVRLMGFSEYSLRVVPLICSLASLFLFRRIAEKLLSGTSALFAFAVFAVSYPGIRYAAEAKPYGIDTFASVLCLSLVLKWCQDREIRWLCSLILITPLLLGVSYPAVFAVGGFSLVVGAALWHTKGTRSEWLIWLNWNAVIAVSFLFWFSTVGRVQSGAEGEFMGDYWKSSFPPVAQPWLLPYWILKTHASDFLAYPLGGPNWASAVTMLLCLAGLFRAIQSRQWLLLGLLIAPASLHLTAAALQKYPYGGHVKFSQYLAPMICCLIGLGGTQLIAWCGRWKWPARSSAAWGCAVLILIGSMSVVRDLANPYKTRSDFRARAFAQSFWPGAHSAEEVACLKSDLGLDFVPDQHVQLSWSAHYRCNRAIEVSRSSLKPVDFDKVSATRPLRCVLYRDARYEVDEEHLNQWLIEMQQKYELIARESVPFARLAKDDRRLVTMEYIDSFKFVPRERLVKD